MPAALQGAPLKAIFFSYRTSTFQLIVRPEITSPQALKGKAIGISSPGSSNDQASRLMMRKLGLEPNRDVTLLSTGDSQARILALETGTVAGSLVNPDVAAHMALRGYRILTNSAEVYPVPFSGMAVHDELIKENPDLIKRWLRAHIRAMVAIRKNPEEAAQLAAKELKLSNDVALGATKLLVPLINAEDPAAFSRKKHAVESRIQRQPSGRRCEQSADFLRSPTLLCCAKHSENWGSIAKTAISASERSWYL